MRRQILMLVAAAALVVPSTSALAHHKEDHRGGKGHGNACPQKSQNPNGKPPSCGRQDPRQGGANGGSRGNQDPSQEKQRPAPTQCNDGIDNDRDGAADTRDPNDCRGDDVTESTTQCNDGIDNDRDGKADGSDQNDCRGGDVSEDTGTCETGGLGGGETLAKDVFGTKNENGPVSGRLHANEATFRELAPVVHEGSCIVATVDDEE